MNHRISLATAGIVAALITAPPALAQEVEVADGPTAQELVGRAIEAMGGQEKFNTLVSLSHTTQAPEEMGMGEIKVQAIFPMHFRVDAETSLRVTAMLCTNGEHSWSIEPGGTEYDIDDLGGSAGHRHHVLAVHPVWRDHDHHDGGARIPP